MTEFGIRARCRAAAAGASVFLVSASPALASSFGVDPVRVDLTNDHKIGALRISNSDREPVSVKVTAVRWTQRNGADVYEDTSDVIASPPIFTVSPGGTQVLRVGMRDGSTAQFRAYRLIVQEIPRISEDPEAVRIVLKLNLPLYALPKTGQTDTLVWRVLRNKNQPPLLEASNEGNQPVRVREIAAVTPSGKRISLSDSFGVVLPGSKRVWELAKEASFDAVGFRTIAKTDSGEQSIQVTDQRP